ncbi:homeodomain-like protein [Artemisia annua]|uniref:Homeodomain-like protein n=1 Tax=Artemisia annua TaxID=35608 RepID=A0A2U1KP60_ARTAN|nr:homeodomain-like protein [Artemisia annua]
MRAPCFDKFGIKKGPWSEDEDDKLRAFIEKYGPFSWSKIPRIAGLSRSGRSCRLRWMNQLCPSVKHGNFTIEEQDVIVDLHSKHGNKWSMIAAQLPGRSENEIKNYCHTHLKNQVQKSNAMRLRAHHGHVTLVLSSNLPPSSSTRELSSLNGSDYIVPSMLTSRFCKQAGSFWTEPFLLYRFMHHQMKKSFHHWAHQTISLARLLSGIINIIDDVGASGPQAPSISNMARDNVSQHSGGTHFYSRYQAPSISDMARDNVSQPSGGTHSYSRDQSPPSWNALNKRDSSSMMIESDNVQEFSGDDFGLKDFLTLGWNANKRDSSSMIIKSDNVQEFSGDDFGLKDFLTLG